MDAHRSEAADEANSADLCKPIEKTGPPNGGGGH
jgi:hypothetical protein